MEPMNGKTAAGIKANYLMVRDMAKDNISAQKIILNIKGNGKMV